MRAVLVLFTIIASVSAKRSRGSAPSSANPVPNNQSRAAMDALLDASMADGSCEDRLHGMVASWRELRRLYGELFCKVHGIGPTGGYCIDLMNLERDAGKDNSNGNAHLDPVLCDLIASTVGRGSSTLVDLGAGVGHYGECLKSKGVNWIGYDGAENVEQATGGGVKWLDLSGRVWLGKKFDWVMSIEVGEHIPQQYESIYLDNLVRHATKGIFLSWALPGQAGHHHVNLRDNKYIIEQMAERGFIYDEELSLATRASQRTQIRCMSLPADYADVLQGRKVLVAGASGKTGRHVVELLQAQGVAVRALVRDKTKVDKEGMFKAGPGPVEVITGDVFKYSTLPPALGDADTVVVATGASDRMDPLGPFNVDFQGTLNLIALAKQRGVKKFVLVTSIGTDDFFNILNLFYLVLFWKKRAEEELQRSGLDYTIIRPGGLKSELKGGEEPGAIIMQGPGFYGVPPAKPGQEEAGSILRKQVAELCVAAIAETSASFKVVEVIAKTSAPSKSYAELYQSVN